MGTTLRLREWTKSKLTDIKDEEDHTSHDSVLKSLIRDHEIVKQAFDNEARGAAVHERGGAVGSTWGPEAYIGRIGTGKTYQMKYHAHELLSDPQTADVYIVDPLGEYRNIAEQLAGETIDGVETAYNPFDFRAPAGNSVAIEDAIGHHAEMIAEYLEMLSNRVFENPVTNHAQVNTGTHKLVMNEAVHRVLEDAGMANDVDVTPEGRVSLHTLSDTFESLADRPSLNYVAAPTTRDAISGAAEDLLELTRLVDENLLSLEIEPEQRRDASVHNCYHFDVSQVSSEPGQVVAAMAAALLNAVELAKTTEGPSVVFVDEGHYLCSDNRARRIFERSMEMAAEHDISVRAAFQTPEELLNASETGVSEYWDRVHFHQCDGVTNVTIAEAFEFSKGQLAFIENAASGVQGDHSEVMVCDIVEGVKTVQTVRPDF